MSNEKKKTIALTIGLSAVLVVLIGFFVVNELRGAGVIGTSDSGKIMNKFEKYFNSKNKVVIYYASTDCGYCSLQTPILEEVAEQYNIDYYYVDTSKLSNSQRSKIMKKLGLEKHATPTTVVVEKGKVIATNVGYVAGTEYVEFFKEAGVVPEDAVYEGERYITFINYAKYESLIKETGTNIVVIGQTTCSHCIAIKPALNTVARDYDIVINYLNLTDMSQDEYSGFVKSLTNIKFNDPDFVNNGSFGTPTTLVIKNGKVSHYISGERSTSQLVREFKKIGIIEG